MVLATGKYTPKKNIEDASEEQIRSAEDIKTQEEKLRLNKEALEKRGLSYTNTATDFLGDDLNKFIEADSISTIPDMRKPFTTRKILMQNTMP